LMGTFTHSIPAAQNYHRMGVPVWLIRPQWAVNPDYIKRYSKSMQRSLQRDPAIIEDEFCVSSDVPDPFPVIYTGLPSPQMQASMQKIGCRIVDGTEASRKAWERLAGAPTQHPQQGM
jgi:hypothetical protein